MRTVRLVLTAGVCLAVLAALPVVAFMQPEESTDLHRLVRSREGAALGVRAIRHSEDEVPGDLRQGWNAFVAAQDGTWKVWLDRRTGLPLLAGGRGVAWVPGPGNDLAAGAPATIDGLEAMAREFLDTHRVLLGDWGSGLVLDREASALKGDRFWQITFRQEVAGVRVDGARYDFQVSQGNLVAFGARHWAPVTVNPAPALSRAEARRKIDEYLGIDRSGTIDLDDGTLHFLVLDADRAEAKAWTGPWGQGLDHRLVWRFSFTDPDSVETWVGEVDAHSGEVVSFFDDTRYERVKGYANPITDDGNCAEGGCIEPDFPMPFADVSENGASPVYTGDFGLFECTIGSTVSTTLIGPYWRINDVCGSISESAVCDDEIDLGQAAGINCSVAPGASPGNTDAARTAFYQINRVTQKARYYMPANTWTRGQTTCRTNVNATCNASWGGQINMYRAGGGCGNTGQNQGVLVHEWGHGMDQNDGGGYDNPSEAYADVVAIFEGRISCVGPGFRPGVNCSGYGDTCLDCTGIRDMDWDMRQDHTPATPSGFLTQYCPGGGGPCGKETHCASYVPSEAIFDLAYRDLPAMGLDPESAWQLADRLWYSSRPGSGGDVYNCSLPSSDSCSATSWYHQLRVMDDDDGNLNNGTPHAAAIFAAFDRHDIACGNAGDPENQNSSSCPSLAAPVVTAQALTNAVQLSWDAVPDAASYRVYRNELGCDRGQFPVGETTSTTFLDDDLANDFAVYYRVEATGANAACVSPVSSCLATAAQPLAGRVKFDQATYGCSNRIGLKVTDANHPTASMTIDLWSDSEPTPEIVTLIETEPGSGKFLGEIWTTGDAPGSDGLLSLANADTITAQYLDQDDGAGGTNIPRQTTALGDCVFPVITAVNEDNVTGTSARVTWTTNEASDTVVNWGSTTPPTQSSTGETRTTNHSVTLGGLTECTVYYYDVSSTDPAGNTAVDDNGGQYFRFETLGDFGSGLQPCHAGQVSVLAPVFSCIDQASFEVVDIDLNADPLVAESVTVLITSTTETSEEMLVLTETGANTSIFRGTIQLAPGAPAPDGVVQASDGDILTATYLDTDDGTGEPAVSFDVAALDCAGPAIENLGVEAITNARATFRFNTQEVADTVVEWGPTPALGEMVSSANQVTYHEATINQFSTCSEVYFRVSSTDVHGNTTVLDNHGEPFRFRTYEIPGVYVYEDFETGGIGWSLGGEWEIDAPQGIGGSAGISDPAGAYNNSAVLGHDLTGLGAYPGDYEPGVNETATSPTWDASSWTNSQLVLHRRLNNGAGDEASLWLFTDGAGRPIFRTEGASSSASSFERIEADLRLLVDGASEVRLEFRQASNTSGNYSGWNVDDIIFKDGTQPDYAVCGGCGTAPSFAGVTSVTDNDACGANGVTVSYQKAVAWGTGTSGTYSVYRDTTPGFTPGPGNRIATGVTSLSYNDTLAPTDATLHYLVRAENDETCSTGPNNGGVTDGNAVYAAVSETTSQPLPPVVETVRVDLVAQSHVRLEWDAVVDATSYRIYRATSPQPDQFGLLAETDGTLFEDVGEGANANTYYYKVVPVNACGQEGP